MKDFFSAGLAGFVIGVLLGVILFVYSLEHADIPVENINKAQQACINANSTLVSTDHHIATCANLAEIPYNRQGSE